MKRSPIWRPLRVLNRLMSKHPQSSAVQRFLGLSPSTPPYHRRSNHLPSLAEATSGPEDVLLVLVAAPVLVRGGSSASTVLCEVGGGIDVTGEEKKGRPKDVTALLPRIRLLCHSALFSEDPCNSSGNHLLIALPIYKETPGEKVILPFIG